MPEGAGPLRDGDPQDSVGSPRRLLDSDHIFYAKSCCTVMSDGSTTIRPDRRALAADRRPLTGTTVHSRCTLGARADLPTTAGPWNRYRGQFADRLPGVPIQQQGAGRLRRFLIPDTAIIIAGTRKCVAALESRLTPPGPVHRICMPLRVCIRCNCVGKRPMTVAQVPAH